VFAAMDAGMTPEEVLLEVIAPVQHKVGTEWAANRISVAQEHASTAINDRVIAALAHHPAGKVVAHGGRVTLACVDGEWHALPARLLAEVLRLRGWRVDFLGAQVPTPHLIAHLHQHGPDVVALSCSIPTRLPNAHAAIIACQSAGFPVLAGGAAFGRDGRFARQLGADAWAPDARNADESLARGFPLSDALSAASRSMTCRTWPTRSTPWRAGARVSWSSPPSPIWRTALPPCAPTPLRSASTQSRTSPTSSTSSL
jgi:methanogenic corrinoid protein MtbC1